MSKSMVKQFEGTADLHDPYKLQALTKALIKFSVQDGDRASQDLSLRLSSIQTQVLALEPKFVSGAAMQDIEASVNLVVSEIMQCFIELQFFDRISQRMGNAIKSLEALGQDEAIQQNVSDHFAMEDERILYNALLNGDDVDDAVRKANIKLVEAFSNNEDDTELF